MDKLEHYRFCIQTLLEKHSQYKSGDEDIESALFFDPVRVGLCPAVGIATN
jgi:hypothetical protein